jgi:hypothetical protein
VRQVARDAAHSGEVFRDYLVKAVPIAVLVGGLAEYYLFWGEFMRAILRMVLQNRNLI